MEYRRVYVRINAEFLPDGRLLPRRVIWDDGRGFDIDRVLDVRPAAALKAGGQGDRYTVRIKGRERYLFFERGQSGESPGRWFVEQRSQ